MRSEQAIFDDLAALCSSPGYVNAIAYLCVRDSMIAYSGEMKPEDMRHMFSKEGLIRTETSVLVGLALKNEIDLSPPTGDVLRGYVQRTEGLLEELHRALAAPFWENLNNIVERSGDSNPFNKGPVLREPIFYGGESAHTFQYRELSLKKYTRDDEWLKTHKGFTIGAAVAVVRAVERVVDIRAARLLHGSKAASAEPETFLRGKTFSAEEVATESGIDIDTVIRILVAFTVPEGNSNRQFAALHDFNIANAQPLIRVGASSFVLFNNCSLSEALYESPFYWMLGDSSYADRSARHRGLFAEEFAAERLSRVFGKTNVHQNVDVFDSLGRKIGEIDVLVLFADRAIVVQAKSKRLTIESRRGNDGQIRDDFKKAIQDSYDQGLRCAKALGDDRYVLKHALSARAIPHGRISRAYPVCLVADHYPAMSFQARQFLQIQPDSRISAPLVLNVFALDEITEMLDSPLQFLSYIDRRTMYGDRLAASDERVILAYHLKQNLWLSDDHGLVTLDDDIAIDLDLAMIVRREGIAGKGTPEGILTRFAGTTLWRWIKEIEALPNPSTIALGDVLLTLDEDTFHQLSQGIDEGVRRARRDQKSHDITVAVAQADVGFTVHCNSDLFEVAGPALERHCRARKYAQKVGRWFGVCVEPSDASVRFALDLTYDWEQNEAMDDLVRDLHAPRRLADLVIPPVAGRRKVGRNSPCPCGSGKKYKKCCLG